METPSWIRRAALWIGSHEKRVLVAGSAAVLGAWAFVEIAEEVAEGETRPFDEWALRWMREPHDPADPVGGVWLEEAARDVTALGSVTVLFLVVASVVIALALQRRRAAMWLVIASTLGGALLSTVLKELFDRDRPGVVPHLTEVLTASFPSGHAMLSAAVYLTLGALLARLAQNPWARAWCLLVAMAVTVLVGVSRVYLGVHYPSDVLAGWAAGMAWALTCWVVARALQRKGRIGGGPGPA